MAGERINKSVEIYGGFGQNMMCYIMKKLSICPQKKIMYIYIYIPRGKESTEVQITQNKGKKVRALTKTEEFTVNSSILVRVLTL